MSERFMREATSDAPARESTRPATVTPRVRIRHATLDHRPFRADQLPNGHQAEFIQTAELRQIRGREGSVVHVEVFQQMGSVRTSILEDLDPYPRTGTATPSTAKSQFTSSFVKRRRT